MEHDVENEDGNPTSNINSAFYTQKKVRWLIIRQ